MMACTFKLLRKTYDRNNQTQLRQTIDVDSPTGNCNNQRVRSRKDLNAGKGFVINYDS